MNPRKFGPIYLVSYKDKLTFFLPKLYKEHYNSQEKMNKVIALVLFVACFSFTEKNVAHAFLPFDILKETAFVGGEVTKAFGEIIQVVTSTLEEEKSRKGSYQERNIRGNLTLFVKDAFLGQMDDAFKAAQGAITALNNLQTTGLGAINKTLDGLHGGIQGFANTLTGGLVKLQ